MWWSWKNWFLTVSSLGGCGGLERTDFYIFLQLIFWVGVVVLKELIFNSFYVGRVWWSWKNWIFTISMMEECGGLERTDFLQFLHWEVVVVLKELIFYSSYFGEVWSGLERTDFLQFLWTEILEECGGLEGTELSVFTFLTISIWKDWLISYIYIMDLMIFLQFLLWEGVVVLKELIF